MATTSAEDLDAWLREAVAAARGAGRMIREAHARRAGGLGVESKPDGGGAASVDLVTATDKACEVYILDALRAAFPSHGFIGEEGSAAGDPPPSGPLRLDGAPPTWIVDPLDGTTNFVHGYCFVTVSIGLVVGGEPVVGVVYNPLLDELCSAARGRGATLNGRPVRCARASKVTEAVIVNNFGASREPSVNEQCTRRLLALLQARVPRHTAASYAPNTPIATARVARAGARARAAQLRLGGAKHARRSVRPPRRVFRRRVRRAVGRVRGRGHRARGGRRLPYGRRRAVRAPRGEGAGAVWE